MENLTDKRNAALEGNTVFCLFLLLYAGALIYLCSQLNVWVDETYTLNTTSRSLTQVMSQAYNFEGQPPVYFVLLSLWRYISSDVFFARFFSICCVGLAAWFFYRLVKLVAAGISSKWMTVIFLLNPFTVWAALEIRLYAFALMLSIIALYFFFLYFNGNKKKHLYFFLVTCLIGVYTQYFFTVLIASLAISVLVFKGWKTAISFCLYLLPVALLFLPNLFFLPEQIRMAQTEKIEYSLSEKFTLALHSPQNLMFAVQSLEADRKIRWLISALFILPLVYAYYRLYKTNRAVHNTQFINSSMSIIAVGFFVLMLSIVAAVLGVDYQDRYVTPAYPLFVLIFTLVSTFSFWGSRLFWMLQAGFYILLLVINYSSMVKQYDFKSISKYITAIERKSEPVLIYHGTVSLSFMYYYKGQNNVYPLPGPIVYNSSTFLDEIKDTLELKNAVEAVPATSSYLLITDLAENKYAGDPNRKKINEYLHTHYTVSLDTLYFGNSKDRPLRIRRLEKK